jgi:predicted house-cleaning noncanonical NTP pyrophosphatase (MazG superfamily)
METYHLVRDNYKGEPIIKKVTGDELLGYLKSKLLNDVTTLIVLPKPNADSFADVLEVLRCLREQLEIPSTQLEKLQEQKANKEGSYITGSLIAI